MAQMFSTVEVNVHDTIPDRMRIVIEDGAFMPIRAHAADAGLDLRSRHDVEIPPRESRCFDTGIHVEIPEGFYGRLEPKSGLHVHHDIVCLGGTIDSGYTGSVVVKLYNFGCEPYPVSKGDKIAQLVIVPCIAPELVLANSLGETERGDNGFGSSGR